MSGRRSGANTAATVAAAVVAFADEVTTTTHGDLSHLTFLEKFAWLKSHNENSPFFSIRKAVPGCSLLNTMTRRGTTY